MAIQTAKTTTNKIALITGGSRGLGRNTAIHLFRRGADLIFTYHSNRSEAESLIREIEAMGQRAAAFRLDTADVHAFDRICRPGPQITWSTTRAIFSRRFCGNDGSSVRWDLQRSCQRRLLPHAETTSSHQRPRPDREYFIRIGSNCSSRKLCVWRGQRNSLGALWCTGRHWADDRRTSFGRQSVGEWAAHRGIGRNVTVSPPNSESRPGRPAAQPVHFGILVATLLQRLHPMIKGGGGFVGRQPIAGCYDEWLNIFGAPGCRRRCAKRGRLTPILH